jgi:apolipoprotein N-acyltransferase
MSSTPPNVAAKPGTINLKEEIAHSEWKTDPIVGFEQRASLVIAQWVLIIFGGVYILAFLVVFVLLFKADATFDKGVEMVRFMIQSLLPLVTLAVGYYLGDRNRQQHQPAGSARKK